MSWYEKLDYTLQSWTLYQWVLLWLAGCAVALLYCINFNIGVLIGAVYARK